jgi:hypothetical protein
VNSVQKQAFVGDLLIGHLSQRLGPGWTRDGSVLSGPGTLGIELAEHGNATNHIDIGFVLNRTRADAPLIWDCASGFGPDPEPALTRAVQTWVDFTLPVIWEFLEQRGDRAMHYPPDDAEGLSGWHCIHGPILGFGQDDDDARAMQRWVVDHPILPQLGDVLGDALDRPLINGVKLLFGGNVSEVRVNGVEAPAASARLRELDWPRTPRPAFTRIFVMAIHPA